MFKKNIIAALFLLSVSLFGNDVKITWVSDPVSPDEAVLVGGWDFSRLISVEVSRVDDGAVGVPCAKDYTVADWQKVEAIQPNPNGFKFVIPNHFSQGIFASRVSGEDCNDIHLINAPDAWWVQGVLSRAVIYANASGEFVVQYDNKIAKFTAEPQGKYRFDRELKDIWH